MNSIASFNQFVPSDFSAPAKVYDLITEIDKIKNLSNDVQDKLQDVKDAYLMVPGSLSNYETPEKIQEFVAKLLNVLPDSKKKKVLQSEYYQAVEKALDEWNKVWKDWLTPIGLANQSFQRDFEINESPTSTLGKFDFTFNYGANAKFALSVVKSADSSTAGFPVAEGEVLINQEINAGVNAGVDASAQFKMITIGAGLSASASGEFDAFYQLDSKTPTYKALWDMYKKPLIPWSLKSMDECLVVAVDNKADGYRAMTLKTQGNLTVSGKLGVGKSISTIKKVNDKDINIGVTLGGSYSRTQTLKGDVTITVTKVPEGLLIESLLNDSNSREDNLSISATANIKGLDQLASKYVAMIIDEGNKVVNLLEKYARPGDILKTEILDKAGDNELFDNLAKLLLGEQTASDAVKSMLTDDLQSQFNETPLSTEADSSELAGKAINKLLALFDVTLPDIPEVSQATEKATEKLAEKIASLQDKVSENATKLIDEINTAGAEALEPLQSLGGEVREALDNLNENVEAKVNKIVSAYTDFRTRLEKALEKSANIKLGLLLEHKKTATENEKNSYDVVIKDPHNADAALLYKCLVLGDGKKAARLISSLPESVIEVKSSSRRFETLLNSETSLGINIADINTTKLKDVASELVLEVDGNGNLTVSQVYKAGAAADGFSEYRKAVMNLTYGIANASSVPSGAGTFGISYTNQDQKLHTVKEMKELLNSLNLANQRDAKRLNFGDGKPLPRLVSQERADAALQKYHNCIQENKYTQSSFDILMAQSEKNFSALLNIDATQTYNYAMEYLVSLTDTSPNTLKIALSIVMDVVMGEVEHVDDLKEAFDYLDKYNKGKLKGITIDQQLSDLKGYKSRNLDSIRRDVSNKRLDQYDWRDVASSLNNYNDTANAIALLGEHMRSIDAAVNEFRQHGDIDNADVLNQKLKQINSDMQSSLKNWVNVTGAWTDRIAEFLSFLGVQSGINVRLLSLLFLLKQVVKTDEELYLITITLQHKSDSSKNKKIIV